MDRTNPKIVKIHCDACHGGLSNHQIVAEHHYWVGGEYDPPTKYEYEICQCKGCDTIRFRVEESCPAEPESIVRVFPDSKPHKRQALPELKDLPRIGRIYVETIRAFSGGAQILAGAGLRAIVEAICIEQSTPGKDLEAKIDGLVKQELLAKPQAELLHEERYIGNTALHEIESPGDDHLALGSDIVEGLLNTIYVLPQKAEQLRSARTKRIGSMNK